MADAGSLWAQRKVLPSLTIDCHGKSIMSWYIPIHEDDINLNFEGIYYEQSIY
jgi:hypothetical protein